NAVDLFQADPFAAAQLEGPAAGQRKAAEHHVLQLAAGAVEAFQLEGDAGLEAPALPARQGLVGVEAAAGEGQVLKPEVTENRRPGPGRPVVVVGHLADHDPGQDAPPHRQPLHPAAPLSGALDHDAVLGVCQVAVPNGHILDAAADLAADADAVAKDAAAVEHPHPAGGPADGVALGVFARFDGY